jgi:ABC-2 type transport system ATP-binding protein
LSGWRNLEILSTYTAPTPARRIQEVVDWVGLGGTDRRGQGEMNYSHGIGPRLALGQALLPQPELLILDEPGGRTAWTPKAFTKCARPSSACIANWA